VTQRRASIGYFDARGQVRREVLESSLTQLLHNLAAGILAVRHVFHLIRPRHRGQAKPVNTRALASSRSRRRAVKIEKSGRGVRRSWRRWDADDFLGIFLSAGLLRAHKSSRSRETFRLGRHRRTSLLWGVMAIFARVDRRAAAQADTRARKLAESRLRSSWQSVVCGSRPRLVIKLGGR